MILHRPASSVLQNADVAIGRLESATRRAFDKNTPKWKFVAGFDWLTWFSAAASLAHLQVVQLSYRASGRLFRHNLARKQAFFAPPLESVRSSWDDGCRDAATPLTQDSLMPQKLAIVLAAGKGTRMESDLPKVLFPVCGRPMIHYVLEALRRGGVEKIIVVVGYRSDLVRQELAGHSDLVFVEQTQQLGTGHAVKVCRDELAAETGPVVIVAGDSPLLQTDSILGLLAAYEKEQPACLLGTLNRPDPQGLGRIVRDDAKEFVGIVEERDATDSQRRITEVNMSTYVFQCQQLVAALDQLRNDNQQQEYYLTDCPGILREAGRKVQALPILQPCESLSINTREHLDAVEAEMRKIGLCEN
jgi:bifunctional UDP-N-acetylglucosamine pyrophosphorylase / glucosamine-1-phosphate N-acetyltransferase